MAGESYRQSFLYGIKYWMVNPLRSSYIAYQGSWKASGAGSHGVATYGSDRVSSLVEYERRLNSWYGEGQHKSIDTIDMMKS